jgi:hypothetical protein
LPETTSPDGSAARHTVSVAPDEASTPAVHEPAAPAADVHHCTTPGTGGAADGDALTLGVGAGVGDGSATTVASAPVPPDVHGPLRAESLGDRLEQAHDLEQVQEAQTIVPIASVQNRYNISERGDDEVVFHCKQHDIAYLPWGPLAARPFDREAPLAGKESVLTNIAARLGATPSQIAIAWLLHRSSNIIVIPGTTCISHLEQNMAAADINLSSSDLAELQDINPDVSPS